MPSVTTAPPSRPGPADKRRRRLTRPAPPSYVPIGPVTLVASFIILVAVMAMNVQYVSLEPGPARDVADLITIKAPAPKDVNGELLLTTVSLRTPPITVGYIVAGWFDPNDLILPRDRVYRPDETKEEADQLAAAQMVTSQESAAAAALSLLGHDVKIETVGVVVLDFPPHGTARTKMRRGDIVTRIDGRPIRSGEDFAAAIDAHGIGDDVVVEVLRRGGRQRVTLTTVERPDRPGEPVIGVEFSGVPIKQAKLPIDIAIDAQGIGGPSAGLMYALGIVDMLNDDDLARGRRIAGTGEIDVDGHVGAVGGIKQKVASVRDEADLFLVPADELADACDVAGDMPVVAVRTLKEAVRALREPAYAALHTCA